MIKILRAYLFSSICHTSLTSPSVVDGGMLGTSAQVMKGLFPQLICTRFTFLFFLQVHFVSISPRFQSHSTNPLHEIDLDAHGTGLQVIHFPYASAVSRIGL